jgi:hypothetical protein
MDQAAGHAAVSCCSQAHALMHEMYGIGPAQST